MKQNLVVIGAGGHGRVVADLARQLGRYGRVLFLDDGEPIGGDIVGGVSDFEKFLPNSEFFVAVGDNATREKISLRLQAGGAKLAALVHPFSSVAEDVVLGGGTVIMAGAVVQTGAVVGSGVIVNTGATVDHDCQLGDFCHVAVGAHLAGTVVVGERTIIGAGAAVINNVTIPSDSAIGAGAVVTKNISERGTYVGVPARRLYADSDPR